MSFFKDKNILIIGGTGTIGHGLIRELVRHEPKVIRIFSRDEYKQFIMEHSNLIQENNKENKFRFLIGDVRDFERLDRAMDDIDIVFNLAAMKHVPSCEYNPDEAIKTNVDGMHNVIKSAMKNNVKCVLFTSSDKAISPTNTYGATKMLAEKLVQAANFSKGKIQTKFIAVRFGNVMGSRGSVIPLFKNQILENKNITITDPEMSRFMMSLSQAVKLMIKSCEISKGGEVFVLKMPVVKLKDLAEVVIEQTCKKYQVEKEKIQVEVIGVRAGERFYEELMTKEESKSAYDLGDMYCVLPNLYLKEYNQCYNKFRKCDIQNYSSNGMECISKEDIKKIIENDNLI
ncbi:SDR family NAD(P)-dependent oxidoreductase [Clostridium novyi]|uniref:UDP-N-acetylglucosamine 4,6-dehydratase n=1 Tax=Clostridium novyi (strain NT) TaxID=386415 RepID=A0Q007_CLONN|nr:SDR family NAD(P)-dependent oxidoreductase [Clostridium novyi]ABK61756.1 UDP-N-acetylglucosamine 4,6-dehydratase [Clostridium novyi NT]KEH86087.1 membrane protein [Clostridium novyi A str. NCTC 538]